MELDSQRIPIIRVGNNLLVSIQIALYDSLVVKLHEDVAFTIKKLEPRGLIIDVTGVEIMDSYIGRAINDIGYTASLMGVDTILVGVRPEVAITLVEMGLEIDAVKTALNIDQALDILAHNADTDLLLNDEEDNNPPDDFLLCGDFDYVEL